VNGDFVGSWTVTRGALLSGDTFNFDLLIEWTSSSGFSLDEPFYWNTGTPPLQWYRVQGCCEYPTAQGDGSGAPGGCEIIGVQHDESVCVSNHQKQQFFQNIVAAGLNDLCNILKNSNTKWSICSIKRWSQPADPRLVIPGECNTLTEIPYCQIPECIDFCMDTEYIVDMRMSVSVSYVYSYVADGGVSFGGSADTIIGSGGTSGEIYKSYVSDGAIVNFGGEADIVSSWENNLKNDMRMSVSLVEESAIFATDPTANSILPLSGSILTLCGNCTSMPRIINVFTNLDSANVLSSFLLRNGLSLPSFFTAYYNQKFNSWVSNYHVTGIGENGLDESWRFTVEWSCTNNIYGEDLTSDYWKFSLLVVQKNNSFSYDTRILIIFPPTGVCNQVPNTYFDFSFYLNTLTNYVGSDAQTTVDSIVLSDGIGLFKSKTWITNPNFEVDLNVSSSINSTQYQTISLSN
jgi:hypothetical protein